VLSFVAPARPAASSSSSVSSWSSARQQTPKHDQQFATNINHRHLNANQLAAISSSSSSSNSATTTTSSIELVECAGDAASIHAAATFMVDAFWLGSERQMIMMPNNNDNDNDNDGTTTTTTTTVTVSDAVRAALVEEQSADLMNHYGERLGQRLLEAGILLAKQQQQQQQQADGDDEQEEILGMVCLAETVLEQTQQESNNGSSSSSSIKVWPAADAETLLKETVAALGPQERRRYKGASAHELIDAQLLSNANNMQAICCLSNLAVAASARRRGVAVALCAALEPVATAWGYTELHLLVEADNAAARRLYENKLGYRVRHTLPSATAIRVSHDRGFVEVPAVETLVMVKALESQ